MNKIKLKKNKNENKNNLMNLIDRFTLLTRLYLLRQCLAVVRLECSLILPLGGISSKIE